MMQSLLLAGNSGGIALALDIEMGFTDRLFAAPISRFAIVLGRLAGTAVLGALGAVWFLVIGLIFGAHIEAGVAGALLVIVLVTLARAVRSAGSARRSRCAPAAPASSRGSSRWSSSSSSSPSAFFPPDLLLEPAKTIAEYNPLSFIAEGMRDPIIFGFSGSRDARRRCSRWPGSRCSASAARARSALRRRLRTGG